MIKDFLVASFKHFSLVIFRQNQISLLGTWTLKSPNILLIEIFFRKFFQDFSLKAIFLVLAK